MHGADAQGRVLLKRKLVRGKVLEFFATLPACLVGLEACGAAHYWARELTKLGHQVRLMPPQYVRPYVKTNKHDAADAEACCEAVQRPGMRFVPGKDEDQQAMLVLHWVRELLTVVSDVEDRRLPPLARELLESLAAHLRDLERRTAELDRRLIEATRDGATCERLTAVPGVGPVIATALVAAVGNAKTFTSGRHLSAWLGLVPRQRSSGGKERLLGLSKRGNGYLRRQLMHGARTLVRVSMGREGKLWSWINDLLSRRAYNVAVAAVANKLARILWALLSRGEDYRVTM
jgi:transposase